MNMEMLEHRLEFARYGFCHPVTPGPARGVSSRDRPRRLGSGCGRLWSVDPVMDREPYENNPVAAAIERSPPKATHGFKPRVRDFADDFWWRQRLNRGLSRLAARPGFLLRFHRVGDSDLKSATSGLRHHPPGFTNGANLWSWQPLVKCR